VFQPLVLTSKPNAGFANLVARGSNPAAGVQVASIEASGRGPRMVYEPNHPDANANGIVAYPSVDHASEMTRLIETSRVYEANLAAFGIAQQMFTRALEMGRSQ
jgi:flagellar basal-body rod protein FlgC